MANDDRTPTALYLAPMGRHLDVVLDVELGELIEGHHVVARDDVVCFDQLPELDVEHDVEMPTHRGQIQRGWRPVIICHGSTTGVRVRRPRSALEQPQDEHAPSEI